MDRSSFVAGLRDVAPALPANATVGMLFGAAATQVGIEASAATAFSFLTVAARAQLAAVELLQNEATLPVVLATIVLINLRYAAFSAALAPKTKHLSKLWRAVIAYPLIDITYTFAEARYAQSDRDQLHRGWYFFAVGATWVVVYTVGTAAGTLVGQALGEGYHLQFMIPLVFISLLVSQVKTRPGVVAAVIGGGVALVTIDVPFNLGLLIAGIVGAIVGGVIDVDPWGWFQ